MFRATGGMILASLLLAFPLACQQQEPDPSVPSGAGATQTGPVPTPAATQGEAATLPENIARAQALLAEFRAAEPNPAEYVDTRPTTGRARAGRSRLDVGRDLIKLDRSAVPLLIKALDDPDPQVSAVAALALGRIGDSRAVEPMLKVLQSFIPVSKSEPRTPPPGHLRAAACVCALGWLREPRAVAPIVALERLPVPYSNLVRELGFQEGSWDYMCGIMSIVCGDAIQRVGSAAAPELVNLLSDADGEIRSTAAEHLGRFGVRDSKFMGGFMAIVGLRPSPDESAELRKKREASEREISDRVAALAGGKLIELLHDKEVNVRREAASALGNLRVASAVGPLIQILKDEHPWVRLDAIRSLGQIGDPVALEALAPLFQNPGPDQFDCAECAVGMIGGPKALALLKSDLENAHPNRRGAAIAGLSLLGTPEAVDLQITALSDKDDNVRFYAARALGALKGAEATRVVEPLIAAARSDGHPAGRRAALESLGSIADPRGVEVAIAALKDPDHSVRAEAVEALGQIKEPISVEPVKAMLKDPNWFVRYHAVRALARLNPPDLSECLRPMLEDESNEVRMPAKWALDEAAKRAVDQLKDR